MWRLAAARRGAVRPAERVAIRGDWSTTSAPRTLTLRRPEILDSRPYHVVVGNPPYIPVKDKARNEAYRERYSTCTGKYSSVGPVHGALLSARAAARDGGGYVGQITANSFMKREFGKKLIEEFLPTVDLQTLIDAAGADIPGTAHRP